MRKVASVVTRWLPRLLGLALGSLFFYAGLQKQAAPYEFTDAILAYRLLPESWAGLTGALLPWVEIVAGAALALGNLVPSGHRSLGEAAVRLRRSALLLLVLLTALFVVVLLITMARGLKIACGCGLFFQRPVGPAALVEDLLLLGVAAWLYGRSDSPA